MNRWDRCRAWIEAAGTGWTFEEIKAGGERGDFLLWEHPEGCMVSEFIISPRHRVMHVWIAGGTLKAIEALLPVVEAYGRTAGCDSGGATGRKGWIRYLAKHDYRPSQAAVEKEL